MGLMSTRDFNNYKTLFNLMIGLIQPPDLLIYLKASISTLVNQIQKRGREYENSIRLDYLRQLNDMYESWTKSYTLGNILVINVDELDFASKKEDLSFVIDKIDARIHGLF
jgi:deoxyadenosine/deoxycytidine kinase